eukprot:gene18913-16990_t
MMQHVPYGAQLGQFNFPNQKQQSKRAAPQLRART